MKPSEFDGKRVLHVDGAANVHNGVIVGQSDDGKAIYVKASHSPGAWDFSITPDLVPVLIKNAEKFSR